MCVDGRAKDGGNLPDWERRVVVGVVPDSIATGVEAMSRGVDRSDTIGNGDDDANTMVHTPPQVCF